ncbi:hypothetical protein P9112_001696 [Eukaryota sp. TZLM1-RC]
MQPSSEPPMEQTEKDIVVEVSDEFPTPDSIPTVFVPMEQAPAPTEPMGRSVVLPTPPTTSCTSSQPPVQPHLPQIVNELRGNIEDPAQNALASEVARLRELDLAKSTELASDQRIDGEPVHEWDLFRSAMRISPKGLAECVTPETLNALRYQEINATQSLNAFGHCHPRCSLFDSANDDISPSNPDLLSTDFLDGKLFLMSLKASVSLSLGTDSSGSGLTSPTSTQMAIL